MLQFFTSSHVCTRLYYILIFLICGLEQVHALAIATESPAQPLVTNHADANITMSRPENRHLLDVRFCNPTQRNTLYLAWEESHQILFRSRLNVLSRPYNVLFSTTITDPRFTRSGLDDLITKIDEEALLDNTHTLPIIVCASQGVLERNYPRLDSLAMVPCLAGRIFYVTDYGPNSYQTTFLCPGSFFERTPTLIPTTGVDCPPVVENKFPLSQGAFIETKGISLLLTRLLLFTRLVFPYDAEKWSRLNSAISARTNPSGKNLAALIYCKSGPLIIHLKISDVRMF